MVHPLGCNAASVLRTASLAVFPFWGEAQSTKRRSRQPLPSLCCACSPREVTVKVATAVNAIHRMQSAIPAVFSGFFSSDLCFTHRVSCGECGFRKCLVPACLRCWREMRLSELLSLSHKCNCALVPVMMRS